MIEIQTIDPSVGSGTIITNGVNKNEQLMLYNDSIYRLRLHFPDKSIGVIPALWNKDYIMPNMPMGDIKWEVIDQLNIANNPFSGLYGEIYEAQEHVAHVNASMQRSVVSSIPGGIAVSNSTLINDGNAMPTKFLEVTPAAAPSSSFSFSSDGSVMIAQDVLNIMTTILQSFPGGATIWQIGMAAKIVEILGQLKSDDIIFAQGGINSNIYRDNVNGISTIDLSAGDGSIRASILGKLTHILGGLTVDQATTLTGSVTFTADPLFSTGRIADGSGNNLIDASTGGMVARGQRSSHNRFTYQGDGVNVDWFLNAMSNFTGVGTGTFNHGMHEFGVSVAPSYISPVTSVAGSQTMGYDTITSTQCHITTGAGLAFKGWCFL